MLALVVVLGVMPKSLELVSRGQLLNPDGYMRLVRMQEAIDSGRWFGNFVSRSDSGAGTLIYWSHFLDALILLIRVPLSIVYSSADSLFWAAAIVTPILTGLLAVVSTWAVAPLVSPQWRWMVALSIPFAVPILNYGQIGMASHHILILVLVVATWGSGGRALFEGSRWGAIAGCFTSLSIWVSPESTPFCMMVFIGLYLAWVSSARPAAAVGLINFGSGFFFSTSFALLVDPPSAGFLSPALDRLSLTFLILALIVLAQSVVPYLLRQYQIPVLKRVLIALLLGLLGVSVWLLLFPSYLHGLQGLMRPEQAAVFFITSEMRGVETLSQFFAYISYGLTLIFLAIYMMLLASNYQLKLFWAYIVVCSLIITILAFNHLRFSIYPAAGGVMLLGIFISTIDKSRFKAAGFIIRPVCIGFFLLSPIALSILSSTADQRELHQVRKAQASRCVLSDVTPYLESYSGSVILTGVNEGPELLYRTPAKIVGALYHAGIDGYMRLRAAWRVGEFDEVPSELRDAKIGYILLCPSPLRSEVVSGKLNTLYDLINEDRAPPWLHLISVPNAPNWRFYRLE